MLPLALKTLMISFSPVPHPRCLNATGAQAVQGDTFMHSGAVPGAPVAVAMGSFSLDRPTGVMGGLGLAACLVALATLRFQHGVGALAGHSGPQTLETRLAC